MKFTFICIVITISCSVGASGDLQIYPVPDYKYNYHRGGFRPRLIRSNDKPLYRNAYNLWPWQNVGLSNFEDEEEEIEENRKNFDFDLSNKRNRQLQELIDKTRNQLKKTLPYHHPQERFEDAYESYRKLESRLHNKIDRNQFEFPNNPILTDVRLYPQDDDFSFREDSNLDDDDEEEQEEEENVQKSDKNFEIKTPKFEGSYGYKGVQNHDILHKTTKGFKHPEEASGRGALEAILVDDPTEFAYAPPDPRFYEAPPEIKVTKPEISTLKAEGVININQRSEYGPSSLKSVDLGVGSRFKNDETVNMVPLKDSQEETKSREIYILALSAGVFAAAIIGSIVIAFTGYTMHKHLKSAMDVEYPAYGVTGPNKDVSPSGDRRLAQSAQMYHYQHQKQQIIAMERASGERHNSLSEPDSEEENEEGDYTVYECPGLAPTGEMEVKNPLFQDDQNSGEVTNGTAKHGEGEKK